MPPPLDTFTIHKIKEFKSEATTWNGNILPQEAINKIFQYNSTPNSPYYTNIVVQFGKLWKT